MKSFSMPWPPSVNHYWRIAGKRMIISDEGKAYHLLTKSAANKHRWPKFGAKPISLAIVVNPPDRRRRDIDNMLKAPLDALAHCGVYEDDSQIYKLSIERGPVVKGGAMTVIIEA